MRRTSDGRLVRARRRSTSIPEPQAGPSEPARVKARKKQQLALQKRSERTDQDDLTAEEKAYWRRSSAQNGDGIHLGGNSNSNHKKTRESKHNRKRTWRELLTRNPIIERQRRDMENLTFWPLAWVNAIISLRRTQMLSQILGYVLLLPFALAYDFAQHPGATAYWLLVLPWVEFWGWPLVLTYFAVADTVISVQEARAWLEGQYRSITLHLGQVPGGGMDFTSVCRLASLDLERALGDIGRWVVGACFAGVQSLVVFAIEIGALFGAWILFYPVFGAFAIGWLAFSTVMVFCHGGSMEVARRRNANNADNEPSKTDADDAKLQGSRSEGIQPAEVQSAGERTPPELDPWEPHAISRRPSTARQLQADYRAAFGSGSESDSDAKQEDSITEPGQQAEGAPTSRSSATETPADPGIPDPLPSNHPTTESTQQADVPTTRPTATRAPVNSGAPDTCLSDEEPEIRRGSDTWEEDFRRTYLCCLRSDIVRMASDPVQNDWPNIHRRLALLDPRDIYAANERLESGVPPAHVLQQLIPDYTYNAESAAGRQPPAQTWTWVSPLDQCVMSAAHAVPRPTRVPTFMTRFRRAWTIWMHERYPDLIGNDLDGKWMDMAHRLSDTEVYQRQTVIDWLRLFENHADLSTEDTRHKVYEVLWESEVPRLSPRTTRSSSVVGNMDQNRGAALSPPTTPVRRESDERLERDIEAAVNNRPRSSEGGVGISGLSNGFVRDSSDEDDVEDGTEQAQPQNEGPPEHLPEVQPVEEEIFEGMMGPLEESSESSSDHLPEIAHSIDHGLEITPSSPHSPLSAEASTWPFEPSSHDQVLQDAAQNIARTLGGGLRRPLPPTPNVPRPASLLTLASDRQKEAGNVDVEG